MAERQEPPAEPDAEATPEPEADREAEDEARARSGIGPDGTWTPAFPGQRPPFPPGHDLGVRFEPGNELGLRHGAYAELRLAPRAAEIVEGLRGQVPARTEADEPTLWLLAQVLARIEAAHVWLAEQDLGIFRTSGGELQPVLRALSTWENTAARLLDRLGCTPTSRAQLGLDLVRTGDALRAHLEERYGRDEEPKAGDA